MINMYVHMYIYLHRTLIVNTKHAWSSWFIKGCFMSYAITSFREKFDLRKVNRKSEDWLFSKESFEKCWMIVRASLWFVVLHTAIILKFIATKKGRNSMYIAANSFNGLFVALFYAYDHQKKEGQLDRKWGLVWPKIRNVFEKQSRWPGPPSWLRIN